MLILNSKQCLLKGTLRKEIIILSHRWNGGYGPLNPPKGDFDYVLLVNHDFRNCCKWENDNFISKIHFLISYLLFCIYLFLSLSWNRWLWHNKKPPFFPKSGFKNILFSLSHEATPAKHNQSPPWGIEGAMTRPKKSLQFNWLILLLVYNSF